MLFITHYWSPVWPNVGINSCPNFLKSCHNWLYAKGAFFQIITKITPNIFCTFAKKLSTITFEIRPIWSHCWSQVHRWLVLHIVRLITFWPRRWPRQASPHFNDLVERDRLDDRLGDLDQWSIILDGWTQLHTHPGWSTLDWNQNPEIFRVDPDQKCG